MESEIKKFIEHSKGGDKYSVWLFFLKDEKGHSAKCKKCAKIMKTAGGSRSGLYTHLKTKHDAILRKRDAIEPLGESSSISDTLPPKITEYFKKTTEDSLAAILSRMTALDGLPFRNFITSDDLRKSLKALNLSDKLPKSATTIQKIVTNYSETIRQLVIKEI